MISDSIIPIVRDAAGLMVRSGFDVMEKGSRVNLVTSSDLAVQDFLVDRLSGLIPGAGFLCEENDLADVSHEYVWIIDPIDGTANYSRGIDHCAVSVALSKDGELISGVVYSPWRNEMFRAEKGGGAFLGDKPIHVSDRGFKDGLMCTAMSTYRKEYAKVCSDIIFDVFMRCNDLRRFGSAAVELCMMAAGQIDLYFEMRLQPWDYAAASLILSEAGGVSCGFDGGHLSLSKPGMTLAANSEENLRELLSTVQRYIPELPY
ncbi:MAG: inositol monophosphatase [Bacteroidales bacterium]|nr:inositol monophosphatase [Bacteroidales bacterium]